MSSEENLDTEIELASPKLYKLVFDNIDKTVNPRFMRSDSHAKSLHYIQIYSVKNCIDFSSLSLSNPSSQFSIFDILPSITDYQRLKDNFAVLIARTLQEHVPFFGSDFKRLIPKHTSHQYSTNMATRSEVVR